MKSVITIFIFLSFLSYHLSLGDDSDDSSDDDGGNMILMCMFFGGPSGTARSDPILNQECVSDHVHTFYGPQNFHPDTTYEDIRDTSPQFSTSQFEENQSLYWHPTIYRISQDSSDTTEYTRVKNLVTSPYYRWDNSVLPETEAFPPGFQMIAYSTQNNLFIECCNYSANGNERCTETDGAMEFPTEDCDHAGIALAMPTCWNGNLGTDNDHIDHMAYTIDGSVEGDCPAGYNRRLPEIQVFVRIINYEGSRYRYTLSDEMDVWHVDFMNGWKEGKLQQILDNCDVIGNGSSYNPPCNCDQFLTYSNRPVGPVCDSDTRNLVSNELTDVITNALPRGTCQGAEVIPKSWIVNPPVTCTEDAICVDSPLPFLVKNKMKDCTWVQAKRARRCNKVGMDLHCPLTCNTCAQYACQNTERSFKIEGITRRKNCNFFARNPQRCNVYDGAKETCRESCGFCD